MTVFDRTDPAQNWLVADWFALIERNGENALMFPVPHTLSSFLEQFAPPNVLLIEIDDRGIWFAVWLTPAQSGAFYSLWIREDKRSTKAAYKLGIETQELALQQFTCLLTLTTQERLLELWKRMGYSILGRIEDLFGPGKGAWFGYLSKEAFDGRSSRRTVK